VVAYSMNSMPSMPSGLVGTGLFSMVFIMIPMICLGAEYSQAHPCKKADMKQNVR
jgi:hypothetical protein